MPHLVELSGWGQIADYLGVSVRTAQIYEHDQHLPVRRLPGAKGRVWALADELNDWKLRRREPASVLIENPRSTEPRPLADVAVGQPPSGHAHLVPSPMTAAGSTKPVEFRQDTFARNAVYGAALTMVLVIAAILILVPRSGPLADFHVRGQKVVAQDANGRELWSYTFPWVLYEQAYLAGQRPLHSWIGDLHGDGKQELLIATKLYKDADVGNFTFCFRADGTLAWKVAAGRAVDDAGGSHMTPPYFVASIEVLRGKTTAETRIAIGSAHHLEQPYQVAFLDINGRVVGEYWHPGHLLHINKAQLDGDGREQLLLAGVNNGDHQATLVVLDPLKVVGVVTPVEMRDRRFALLNMAPAHEKAVVLFPRSCISVGAPYTRAKFMSVSDDRITVVVSEGPAEQQDPGFIYEFDRALHIVGVQAEGPGTIRKHEELERQGKLDHAFDLARECSRLRTNVTIRRSE
jgi:hypothetical protein